MIEISNLKKRYGKLVAVDGFSLKVDKGETVVIMGPSGCGKSTVIRCVNRLIEPDEGEVLINGRSVLKMNYSELRMTRRRIGFVFQHFNLIKRLSAVQNVEFGLVMAGMPQREARAKAMACLARVGLDSMKDKFPHELSGGEQQRVSIARALALDPELMLLDEPTASLDPILVREVLDVMELLVRGMNTTMIIVTHEVAFARKVADRVVLMERGRLVEEGPPERVFERPTSEIGKKYARLLAA